MLYLTCRGRAGPSVGTTQNTSTTEAGTSSSVRVAGLCTITRYLVPASLTPVFLSSSAASPSPLSAPAPNGEAGRFAGKLINVISVMRFGSGARRMRDTEMLHINTDRFLPIRVNLSGVGEGIKWVLLRREAPRSQGRESVVRAEKMQMERYAVFFTCIT